MSSRPWWRLVRLAWLVVALFGAAVFWLSLPALLQTAPSAPRWPNWTAAEAQQALAQLRWSLSAWQVVPKASVLLPLYYMLLGAFIFWRRPNDPVAVLLSFWIFTFLSSGAYTAMASLSWAGRLTDSLSTTLFFLVFYVFPDGRFVPRWTSWAALLMAGVQAVRLFRPDWYDQVAFPAVVPFLVTVTIAQVYRYARVSGPVQRQQTKWVVFGLAAGAGPLIMVLALVAIVPELHAPTAAAMAVLMLGDLLWFAFLVELPFSITMAILRSRLFDIDVLIRRTLIYAALTALLALAYFGSVVVLQGLFAALTGQSQSTLVTVFSTLVIAVLVVPLRARVQAFIDRRFYRRKYDAAKTLAAFSATLRDEVELDVLTQHLVGTVQTTMEPASVGLWLKPVD